jgi:cell wall-associated NlpC family hydrolase
MPNYKVTAQGGLNIRSGPGTAYEDVGDLIYNEIVQSPDTTGWVPVLVIDEDDGLESVAWASAKYLVKATTPDPVGPVAPSTKPTGKAVISKAMSQSGDPYIFGTEVDLGDPDPDAFDCSELVQWVCAQLHISPTMPDGASNQYEHCKRYGTVLLVSEAVSTPGSLLFRLYATGNHVVISQGDGSTIEAKGAAYGVGVFSTAGRGWNAAALIPGVSYG